MHIVIIGAGSVGFHVATQLIEENKDVVLIEKDPVRARYADTHLDCLVLNDEGNNIEVLKKAGIHKADFFISVTNSDEVNMISCGLVSSTFNVPCKIARVRNLDYSRAEILDKHFLGIDFMVNPEVEAARVITHTVLQGAVSDVMVFEKTNVQMRSLVVDSRSFFLDKTLREIKTLINEEFLIAGINRGQSVIIPSGSTRVLESDKLYLVSNRANLEKVFAKSGRQITPIKSVVIVGGGSIGTYVTEQLIPHGLTLRIIESDYERCKELSSRFPEALIINADISDEGIFDEEQLHHQDLIITTTENQELNILAATYGKSRGIRRAIALVGKSNYLTIASNLGIDATISPKSSSADTILKYIRGSNIQSVHSIFNGKAEVIEMSIVSANGITDVPLKELRMPGNSLIVSVTRGDSNFVPNGDFVMLAKDNVLIIAKKRSIPKIESMFLKNP